MTIFCYGIRLASEFNQLTSYTKSEGLGQIWIHSVKHRQRSDYRYRSKRIPLKVFTGSGSAKVLALLNVGPTVKCIRATMSESSVQKLLQVINVRTCVSCWRGTDWVDQRVRGPESDDVSRWLHNNETRWRRHFFQLLTKVFPVSAFCRSQEILLSHEEYIIMWLLLKIV